MRHLTLLNDKRLRSLFRHAVARKLEPGTQMYKAGDMLDNTFCLLIEGDLKVQTAEGYWGTIKPGCIFGEIAYFLPERTRTATISAAEEPAVVLVFQLTPKQLRRAFPELYSSLRGTAFNTTAADAQRVLPRGPQHRP